MVAHLGHPVFEVLEWVSIPGASTAHHLAREAGSKREIDKFRLACSLKGETVALDASNAIRAQAIKFAATGGFGPISSIQKHIHGDSLKSWPTLPQALQWCRLSVRLKSDVQFMHIIT